jgi:hypothetical protein
VTAKEKAMAFRVRTVLIALVAAVCAASSAGALEDLTGSWAGTATCDSVTPGLHEKAKEAFSIVIDDDESGNAFLTAGAATFHVTVIEDANAPAKGRVGGQECNADAGNGVDALALTVKAKDGSDKGTMSGVLVGVRTNPTFRVQTCNLKLKRTTTTIETPITACPL